jgi:S1-C subfamily serine protease
MHAVRQSKRSIAILAVSVMFALGHPSFAKDHLSITSVPAGATVEIDGIAVGKTPYEVVVPGGYIHGAKSVFGKLLRQQMHLRLLLDGYLPLDADLARGPMPWIAFNGTYHGDYWLLKTPNFNFTLSKAATTFTGNVQAAIARPELAAIQSLTTEEIVRVASPSVLLLRSSEGTGSGFIVTNTGVAVTNAHVAKGQTILAATAANGQTFNARVEYVDPSLDLALIKLEGDSFSHLTVGNLSTVQPGSSVVAIGTPSHGFQNTVTKGIVSAIGSMASEAGTWIQTDTAINPGNSGGPLLNVSGQVIGITTQKEFFSSDRRPLQGIGFALSSQDLLTVLRRFYPSIDAPSVPADSRTGSGAVEFSSNFEGADIYVDERFVGNTPSTLTLASGTHQIRLEAPDHVAWAKQLEVLKDSHINLKANLAAAAPSSGLAVARATTSDAHTLNSSRTESNPVHLDPSNSQLKISDRTTTTQALPPEKAASTWTTKQVKLPTMEARVTIVSIPAGAELFIDSTGAGHAPQSLTLPPGRHSVQLAMQGYKDDVQSVSVQAGYELTIDVKMQK